MKMHEFLKTVSHCGSVVRALIDKVRGRHYQANICICMHENKLVNIKTDLVIEVSVIASPLMAPSLSKVTELLRKRNMAENNRDALAFITNANITRTTHSTAELQPNRQGEV